MLKEGFQQKPKSFNKNIQLKKLVGIDRNHLSIFLLDHPGGRIFNQPDSIIKNGLAKEYTHCYSVWSRDIYVL